MTAALIFAGWALCGFLAYGRTLAHLQREYPSIADHSRNSDRSLALLNAIGGPAFIIPVLIFTRHGFMWRLPPRDGS